MAHNIGFLSDGRRSFAFRGDRNDIWHRLGNQHEDGWTVQDWARNSGLDWEAVKLPAFVDHSTLHFARSADPLARVANRWFVCRGDNGNVLSEGTVTDQYKIVQPAECLDFCEQYVAADPNFKLDTAMSLRGGAIIAVTAVYEDQNVCGERHRARLLMTTSMDGSGSTLARGLMTRVVCNNTLDAGIAEKDKSVIRVRHSTKFDAERAGKELAVIVQSFAKYKAMGEAMARVHMQDTELSRFFKATLDIKPDDKLDDLSTKKQNDFRELFNCYKVGINQEGLDRNTGYSAMQAITRYVDHNKTVRGGDGTAQSTHEQRLLSANFGGSGQLMKQKAVAYLDEMSDGALLAAVSQVTAPEQAARNRSDEDDFSQLLKAPLRRN